MNETPQGGRTDGSHAVASRAVSTADIDVERERARTRGCEVHHHLNAAGAALPTTEIVDTVVEHLRREEIEGGYEAAAMVSDHIEAAYRAAGDLIGASSDEIAMTDSASTGLRVVLDAIRPGSDDTLVVSSSAYVSHALHLLTIASEAGARIEVVPAEADGRMDLEWLEAVLRRSDRAIVCPAHIPTSSGLVEPVEEIGALARRYGATYVLDATQSVGQIPVDVGAIGCDALVTTGRKFLRAPRGTAFFYVRQDTVGRLAPSAPDVRGAVWNEDDHWDLVDSAKRFEVWESYVAGRLGLGVALTQAHDRGMAATARYLIELADRMRAGLGAFPHVVLADPAECSSAIVTFSVEGLDPRSVVKQLTSQNVRLVAVPNTHAQWDLGRRGLDAVVRASVHVYNNTDDVDALVSAVGKIAARVP